MKTILIAIVTFSLVPVSFSATVSLVATGRITNEWESAFPTTENGDDFKLYVSFTDREPVIPVGSSFSDPFSPEDLTVTLEILGKGIIFQRLGGSISSGTQCYLSPGPPCHPSVRITSPLLGDSVFILSFSDLDNSVPADEIIRTSYASFEEYESIDFRINPAFPNLAGANLTGAVSSLAVPEPSTASIVTLSFLVIMTKRRPRKLDLSNKA